MRHESVPQDQSTGERTPDTPGQATAAHDDQVLENRDLPPGVSGPKGWLFKVIKNEKLAFLFVGGVNTVVGTVWYAVFYWMMRGVGGRLGHYLALVPTYIASILCAFFLYRTLVFRVRGHVLRDLLRFSSVYLTTFLVNIPLMAVMTELLHLSPIVAQVVNVIITTITSFVFHKRFSFRRSPSEREEQS